MIYIILIDGQLEFIDLNSNIGLGVMNYLFIKFSDPSNRQIEDWLQNIPVIALEKMKLNYDSCPLYFQCLISI